jgi:hypothetical protein
MKLDIRVPIGLLFTVIGALLVIQGLLIGASEQPASARSDLDLWWGALLVVFGVGMLLFARRHAATSKH